MTATQISFADFAAAQTQVAAMPAQSIHECAKYLQFCKDRQASRQLDYSLDLPSDMFLLLSDHHQGWNQDSECWDHARELATKIIGKGSEPNVKKYEGVMKPSKTVNLYQLREEFQWQKLNFGACMDGTHQIPQGSHTCEEFTDCFHARGHLRR